MLVSDPLTLDFPDPVAPITLQVVSNHSLIGHLQRGQEGMILRDRGPVYTCHRAGHAWSNKLLLQGSVGGTLQIDGV